MILGGKFLLLRRLNKFQNSLAVLVRHFTIVTLEGVQRPIGPMHYTTF
jgi:hypothetical protein